MMPGWLHLMLMPSGALAVLSVPEVVLAVCLLVPKVLSTNSSAETLQTNGKLSADPPQTNDKFQGEILRTNGKWSAETPQTNGKLAVDDAG